jgi:hypothetical protein
MALVRLISAAIRLAEPLVFKAFALRRSIVLGIISKGEVVLSQGCLELGLSDLCGLHSTEVRAVLGEWGEVAVAHYKVMLLNSLPGLFRVIQSCHISRHWTTDKLLLRMTLH